MTKPISILWLLTASLCLALPVFLPSYPNPANFFTDPLSLSTILMTAITFPSGLLSSPLAAAGDLVFGIDPNTIVGQYLNLKLMFVLGLAQWFWLVPKIFKRGARRGLIIVKSGATGELTEPLDRMWPSDKGDARSPLEKALDDRS